MTDILDRKLIFAELDVYIFYRFGEYIQDQRAHFRHSNWLLASVQIRDTASLDSPFIPSLVLH